MQMKLLDYGKLNPFGDTVGGVRHLAWPVNAYRVTLPKSSDDGDGLNPFERVVLKLLNAVGAMTDRALADETCIPLDLVKGILLRLQDKGFIDEHNTIVEQDYFRSESREESPPIFVTAILFRELATGKLLPFLHFLNDSNPLRRREEEKLIRAISANQVHKQNVPMPRDVINALRVMEKRSKASLNHHTIPAVLQITIVPQPETHHLYCPIAIQKSDGEFRIADPFGNGFSLSLERAFEQLLESDSKLAGWLCDWKESLRNPRPPKPDDPNGQPKEPFDNEANWQRYPKLVATLRLSRNTPYRSIFKIHAALEWAMFYVCSRRPLEDAIRKLKLTSQLEHSELLGDAAERVGLTLPELGFRPIPEGKLLDMQNGQAELGTVLAIAILQAEKDDSHPLRRVASSNPDLINRLIEIKKKRDEKAHGRGGIDEGDIELPDDPFMRQVVHALLTDIRFPDTPLSGPDNDDCADSLLEARASIQGVFGFKVWNRIGSNLQNRLIHAERFWLSCKDNDDALAFACDLYAAVQSAFEKHLVGNWPQDISDSEFITAAEKKAANVGLCEAFPKCLRTVKILAIRQTLEGYGQTLGSCVIAFLLMSNHDILRAFAESQTAFIDDISYLIICRGHGNEPRPLPKSEIARLRKASYSIIQTLFEA